MCIFITTIILIYFFVVYFILPKEFNKFPKNDPTIFTGTISFQVLINKQLFKLLDVVPGLLKNEIMLIIKEDEELDFIFDKGIEGMVFVKNKMIDFTIRDQEKNNEI